MAALLKKLALLGVVALLLAAVVGYGVYRRAVTLVEERVEHGPWQVPSSIYPSSWDVRVGGALPPGPLAETLQGMGYLRAPTPARPGEFSAVKEGVRVFPHVGWPSLADVPNEAVDILVKDGVVSEIRRKKGAVPSHVVIPPRALAEVRGPEQQSRKPVTLKDVPKALQDAVLAVEDRRFLEHRGVDPRGVLRALFTNVVSGEHSQGGSTLTQQLAKNMFLTQEKTYARKVKELFFAVALENRYTKQQILELYLNEIYLGQRGAVSILGVGQASLAFFSKDVSRLKVEECALLAGLIQAPNAYAPDRHPEKAKVRRDVVLKLMAEQGRIPPDELKRATATPINLRPMVLAARNAPWAVDDVTEALNTVLPGVELAADGLHVETTLDARIQHLAEGALTRGLERLDKTVQVALEGAVMVVDPRSGAVLAMVGGRSYADSQFNRATRGKRQPGSSFKPLMMLGAFHLSQERLGPTSTIVDEPLTVTVSGKQWSPRNSDRRFHGEVTLRETLEQSLNVPSVKVALQAGLPQLTEFLGGLGLQGRLEPVPSLALGVFELTPWELAGAYTALAHDGTYHPPHLIRRVVDAQGNVLMEGGPSARRVASEQEAFLVRDILRGVLDHGTARSARTLGYTFPASGKTGTTSDGKDAWFVGFDAQLLTVVWVGADTPVPSGITGGAAALPIWVDLMSAVRKDVAPPVDVVPKGLNTLVMCEQTRARALSSCPAQHREVYWNGTEPEAYCTAHAGQADRLEALLRAIPARLQSLFGAIRD